MEQALVNDALLIDFPPDTYGHVVYGGLPLPELSHCLVTPLPACHAPELQPLIYLIEQDGQTLLYGNDTGIFEEAVWEFLKGKRLDLVSLDCTHSNMPTIGYNYHMTLNMNCQVRDRLMALGCADENTIFYANHFSHNGDDVLYEEFCSVAKERGFHVSYDGCTVMI